LPTKLLIAADRAGCKVVQGHPQAMCPKGFSPRITNEQDVANLFRRKTKVFSDVPQYLMNLVPFERAKIKRGSGGTLINKPAG
jgi:hypothetical protein